MIREDIGSVVVLDGAKLAGILTLREILKGLDALGAGLLDAPVSTVMTPPRPWSTRRIPPDSLRALMTDRHVSHAPVVKDGRLVASSPSTTSPAARSRTSLLKIAC